MNYYESLGINKNASKDEIKKSFRKLSLQHHPDRPNGNSEKFKEINEAYETLSDPQKKRMYDLRNSGGIPGMSGMSGMHNMGSMPGMGNPEDFFKMFFGGMPGVQMHMGQMNPNIPRANINIRRMMMPSTIHKKLTISIEEAFKGLNYPLEIEREVYEEDGSIRRESEKIYIDIPKGVDTNEMIIIRGKGNCNQMKAYGDIKVIINVENDTKFVRQGLNIYYIKEITLKEALVGFDIEFKHLNGKNYNMNHSGHGVINPSSQLNMDKMGFQRGDHIGALIIKFKIEFPKQLTEEQKSTLLEIL
jgi:DnaJ-class molecular chaperone